MSICTSLDLYFKMSPSMSENQVKEYQSCVVSHHPLRRGTGRYNTHAIDLKEKCGFLQ